jgi:uncharacterized membrane protein YGL010W
MRKFLDALATQRYYHHSRINQSLHFVSASSFLCAYVLLFTNRTTAGWKRSAISVGIPGTSIPSRCGA